MIRATYFMKSKVVHVETEDGFTKIPFKEFRIVDSIGGNPLQRWLWERAISRMSEERVKLIVDVLYSKGTEVEVVFQA